jgi:hypothetical protein
MTICTVPLNGRKRVRKEHETHSSEVPSGVVRKLRKAKRFPDNTLASERSVSVKEEAKRRTVCEFTQKKKEKKTEAEAERMQTP